MRGEVDDNLEKLSEILENSRPPMFAAVGDYVTRNIIEAGMQPDIAVIDHRIMREDVEPFNFRREKAYVLNPQGSVTVESQRVLHDAITFNRKLGVVVEGEEDLLVLPLMAMMPTGSVIVYGQPREGMVVVTLTEERRRWAKHFMTMMEEKEN